MPKPFDAATKMLVQAHPADWVALAGFPAASKVEVVEAEVSTVTSAADKVIRVHAPRPYICHLEFQASHDRGLDGRLFLYNALLRARYEVSVRSVAFLLRPEAQGPGVTGRVLDEFGGAEQDHGLDFRYRLVRVWECPVEAVLAGGLGTLPLAPISAVEPARLPEVVRQMKDRLDREAPREQVGDL